MKNSAKYILIGFIIAVCIGLVFYNSNNHERKEAIYNKQIDSIQAVIAMQQVQVSSYKKEVIQLNHSQSYHVGRADSLQKLLDNPLANHTCPEKVEILTDQVTELRSGLEECNKQKAIYVKTISVQELTIENCVKISDIKDLKYDSCKDEIKRAHRKGLFKGAGGVAVIVLILLLL